MISALTGTLERVTDDRAYLQAGAVLFEVLVPAADAPALESSRGQLITLHTLMYLEGDPNRGNLEPRLLGFLRIDDRAFFELFTTVKGIGPKTALRALTIPIEQIAAAIEARDAKSLVQLDGIGKRSAELIIAELAGKCGKFAGEAVVGAARIGKASPAGRSYTPDQEDAIRALVNLGERRLDAEALLDRAHRANPAAKDANALVTEMLRQRGG
jgi:Holliday junction DNA helicase RuvA